MASGARVVFLERHLVHDVLVQGEGQHATVWSDVHDESTFRDELEGA